MYSMEGSQLYDATLSPHGPDTIQPCDANHCRNSDFAVHGARLIRTLTLHSLKAILGATVSDYERGRRPGSTKRCLQILQPHRTKLRQQTFCGSRATNYLY